MKAVTCDGLRFRYPGESFALEVDEFFVKKQEKLALVGPSGCGKTTLLNLIAGILRPVAGVVSVGEVEIAALSAAELQAFRLQSIGLVPQNFALLDYLSARENVLLPCRLSSNSKQSRDELIARCEELMSRCGLADCQRRFPDELSQGERQRVALCRALITEPLLILADEPTGNLDPDNQEKVVDLLLEQAGMIGAAVIMVSHEPTLLPRFDRTVNLPDIRSQQSQEGE